MGASLLTMFVAMQRIGVGHLPDDWAIVAVHWILFAGLIVLAVMDLEAYLVDIRVTWIISAVAVAGHTVWTPGGAGWIRPGPQLATVSIAALAGLILGALFFLRRRQESGPQPRQRQHGSVHHVGSFADRLVCRA